MSDRLDELRRQRELLGEQLAALDREIAAQEAFPHAGDLDVGAPSAPGIHEDPRDAEAILEEFRRPHESIAKQTKLGCILYFAGAMALLALALAAIYFIERGARGR